MSNDKQTNKPTHIAYHVREGEENKAYFNRIGAAFPHKDGEGLDVVLDATPVNGRITLRTAKERLNEMRDQEGDGRGDDRDGKRVSGREDRRTRDNGPRYER